MDEEYLRIKSDDGEERAATLLAWSTYKPYAETKQIVL